MGTALAVVATGYSAYRAKRTGDAIKTQASAMERMSNIQSDIAMQQWQRFLDTFAPLEEKIVEEAQLPVEQQPGFARMMGTIDRGYSDMAGNVRRTMGGRYPSGAGLEQEVMRNIELGRGRTKAGAVADMNTQRLANMFSAANLGRNLPATSIYGASSAGGLRSNLAQMYAGSAQGTWDSLGKTIGNMAQKYLLKDTWNLKDMMPGDEPFTVQGSGALPWEYIYQPSPN